MLSAGGPPITSAALLSPVDAARLGDDKQQHARSADHHDDSGALQPQMLGDGAHQIVSDIENL
jgi:hypothetical protein